MATMHVALVSVEQQVWQGEASAVFARTPEGDLGVLPGHAPLLGLLVEGEVKIKGEGEEVVAQVDGGFLSVEHDRVTIVAESARVGADRQS